MVKVFVGIALTVSATMMSTFNKPQGYQITDNLTVAIAKPWQIGFQAPASPVFEGIVNFHDDLMIFLTFIFGFVLYILYACFARFAITDKNSGREAVRLVHASVIEIIWTIIPALILIVIAIPSFSLLYSVDEMIEPLFTVKVVGHQWYWSYEFLDPEVIAQLYSEEIGKDGVTFETEGTANFDSYMLADDEIEANWIKDLPAYRLLTVDNHLFIPTRTQVRAVITSSDVLHSWAVPALGVKLDACPGRLNQTSVFIKREGIYYGQCSELCGVNHGFMPIGIVSRDLYQPRQGRIEDLEVILASLEAIAIE